MDLPAIIAEVEGAAQQEAAGIAILETTHFEPELGLTVERCLAAAKRRAEGLGRAAELLRHLAPIEDPRATEMRSLMARSA